MKTDLYKVICCENTLYYPDQLFIDIGPAEFFTHEKLFNARQSLNPKLQYDDEISGGIVLKDYGETIKLGYEMACNYSLKRYQENLKKRINPLIEKMFFEMKKRGLDRTIQVSVTGTRELLNLSMCQTKTPQSAKEEEFYQKVALAKKRAKLLKIKQEYYAKQQYADRPHIMLQWKQAKYLGD